MNILPDGIRVFASYIVSPLGVVFILLLLATGVSRVIWRGSRIFSTLLRVAAVLFVLWLFGGLLEAMGLPVREWTVSGFTWLWGVLSWVWREAATPM